MLRGHFRHFAAHTLIVALLASPILAASPGDVSRQAASQPTGQPPVAAQADQQHSEVQNAVNLRPVGQTADVESRSQVMQTAGTSSGLLGSLFGGKKQADQPATPASRTPATVDWQGIPYHQARSHTPSQTKTPIRDPGPGETRITSDSRLMPQRATPQLSRPAALQNPPSAVPTPPSLAEASSRRAVPAKVVSSRITRNDEPVLSPLSSSRRSGRRDVPTLHASEVAAAQPESIDSDHSNDDLVPKVSRRRIKPEPEAVAETTPATTQTESAEPEPQPTPAADVAVKSQPKPAAAIPAESTDNTIAEPSLPAASLPAEALPAESVAASDQADHFRANSLAATPQSMTSPEAAPLPAPNAATPAPVPGTPRLGTTGSVAGFRSGPPAEAFQPSAGTDNSQSPIGSGIVETQPETESETAPTAPASRIAQTPAFRDPYRAANNTLGTPHASAPTSAAQHLPPAAVHPPAPSIASRASAASRADAFGATPFGPEPSAQRELSRRLGGNELAVGQTAVASELPGIRVVTHGPSSVTIRQNHEFEIRVENRGSIDASGVMIRALVPNWADVRGQSTSRGEVESKPFESNDRLVWTLESLPAGTTERMLVRLQANRSGTHGLDVDWTLVPQKSIARIEVREPKLDLQIEGPEEVVYGQSQTYKVRVLNPGDGIAPNVVFTLSPNSSTPQTQRIGDIPSGKEAQFEVELTAQDLGDLKIHGLASGDLDLKAEAEKSIRVSAAQLEAVFAGPELKYQNTDAMFHLEVTNTGTATCKNIEASLALPPGIRYIGGIESAKQRVSKLTWEIESLPPGATRDYEFKCAMISPGKQTFAFDAHGSAAGKTAVALDTQVESIADLVMTIQDPAAPAPVGSEVIYEIVIKNRGSRQAKEVRAIAQFSNGIEPRRIEGHSGQVLTGQVLFDPITSIRAGGEVRIRVIAEAESEGHHRFRTEIRSGETVLVSEEATQFLNKRSERVSRRSSSSNLR
ncbi:hypothetical protein NHH03_18710 [Stieleria sp. TO1_6]|uniref:hypothetical protein n=1 Tax=Stieleria tagensis TaxID=2956795 RepID=UPI00209B6DC4|nr:hypothetical protein [Stieleria tagensis]MCO8123783.1 hypothetical protein [Stieleria tagensis]